MSVPIMATILHKNCETASPSPSVNVVWFDYSVTGCKFVLETLLKITTLTEGGGDVTGARKNDFSAVETREY